VKQRTLDVITVIIIVLLNVWLLLIGGGAGGRGHDYYETQIDANYED